MSDLRLKPKTYDAYMKCVLYTQFGYYDRGASFGHSRRGEFKPGRGEELLNEFMDLLEEDIKEQYAKD